MPTPGSTTAESLIPQDYGSPTGRKERALARVRAAWRDGQPRTSGTEPLEPLWFRTGRLPGRARATLRTAIARAGCVDNTVVY
ncbi:hypothetical protein JCM9957A_60760 [Kineosporia succinea]